MNFLEKDLEEIIFNSDRTNLNKRGLYIDGVIKRQLRIGNYGTADLVTFNRDFNITAKPSPYDGVMCPFLHITVYELKKGKVGLDAFMQAVRYAKGIQRYIETRDKMLNVSYSICLIGREMDKSTSFPYLNDLIPNNNTEFNDNPFLSVYTYRYDIDGIEFNEQECYTLTDEGF